MGTANPYQVPRSNLDRHVQGDYSEVKVLSTIRPHRTPKILGIFDGL